MFSTSNLVFRFQNRIDYLKIFNIKKVRNPIFFHGIFFKIVSPSKSPAWSGNSKSLKKNEIRPREFWQINWMCSGILRSIQLYLASTFGRHPSTNRSRTATVSLKHRMGHWIHQPHTIHHSYCETHKLYGCPAGT